LYFSICQIYRIANQQYNRLFKRIDLFNKRADLEDKRKVLDNIFLWFSSQNST